MFVLCTLGFSRFSGHSDGSCNERLLHVACKSGQINRGRSLLTARDSEQRLARPWWWRLNRATGRAAEIAQTAMKKPGTKGGFPLMRAVASCCLSNPEVESTVNHCSSIRVGGFNEPLPKSPCSHTAAWAGEPRAHVRQCPTLCCTHLPRTSTTSRRGPRRCFRCRCGGGQRSHSARR